MAEMPVTISTTEDLDQMNYWVSVSIIHDIIGYMSFSQYRLKTDVALCETCGSTKMQLPMPLVVIHRRWKLNLTEKKYSNESCCDCDSSLRHNGGRVFVIELLEYQAVNPSVEEVLDALTEK